MRTALTTTGTDLDAPLGDRFGRTPKYLIYETETGTFVVKSNERSMNQPKGAGIRLAITLAEEHIDAVISRHIGRVAYETLSAADITVFTCRAETVREAIRQLIGGELMEAHEADVTAHAHRIQP